MNEAIRILYLHLVDLINSSLTAQKEGNEDRVAVLEEKINQVNDGITIIKHHKDGKN